MIRMLVFTTLLLATACTEVENAVDRTARQGAKGVVTEVLATRFPAVPKEMITPFSDCVIDNADAVEIRDFARAAISGVDDKTVEVVRTVLRRRETISCLGGSAGLLLGA